MRVFNIILGGYLIFTVVKISDRNLRDYIVMAYLILPTIPTYHGVDNIHALINGVFFAVISSYNHVIDPFVYMS